MYLTSSEVEQLELLKKKTPIERFRLAADLIQGQIEAMKAGIRYRNPNISEEELKKCLRERILKIYSLKL